MTHAYQEIYLNKGQAALADAFDYAINTCKISGSNFINLFLSSTVSKRLENGEPAVIAGKSGIEIAIDIILETTGKIIDLGKPVSINRSIEYWIGWSIAYYQWYSSRKYSEIFEALSYDDFYKMHYTLHEADITKFCDIVDERIRKYSTETNLKRIRILYGITQAQLAKSSNTSLRSIQMYEQRQKDINKASAETLYNISKVLGCSIEDLIEK